MTDCIEPPPIAYEETPADGTWIEEDGGMVFVPARILTDTDEI